MGMMMMMMRMMMLVFEIDVSFTVDFCELH